MSKAFYYFNVREISTHTKKEHGLHNLFTENGDDWKVLRQNVTPLFFQEKWQKCIKYFIEKCAHKFEHLLDKVITTSKDVNVIDLMQRFTI